MASLNCKFESFRDPLFADPWSVPLQSHDRSRAEEIFLDLIN